MVKIAVLVSGGGTNLQALIDREQQDRACNVGGDCVHIPANAPHSWKNPTAHTAKLFGAYCV